MESECGNHRANNHWFGNSAAKEKKIFALAIVRKIVLCNSWKLDEGCEMLLCLFRCCVAQVTRAVALNQQLITATFDWRTFVFTRLLAFANWWEPFVSNNKSASINGQIIRFKSIKHWTMCGRCGQTLIKLNFDTISFATAKTTKLQ